MGITGDGDRKLAELAARLADADPLLRNQLRRRWTAALSPAVDEVKNAILTAPVKLPPRGLRERIAATVHPEVRLAGKVQVSIVSRGGEMPEGQSELPKHFDTGAFRHPVFGEDRWVTQLSNRPGWWTLTNLAQQARFSQAAQQVLDQVGRDLEG